MGARLRIDEYIQWHDVALHPFLQTFFDSLDCHMVTFEEFLNAFQSDVYRALDYLDNTFVEGTVIYLWGGEKFGKSNTWLNMIFWDMYRKKFNGRNVFDFRMIGDESKISPKEEKDILLHVDDCMYSGKQMRDALNDSFFNVIICPYMSKIAKSNLYERLSYFKGYNG